MRYTDLLGRQADYMQSSPSMTPVLSAVWPEGETARGLDPGLDPDGYVVRRTDDRHHAQENRDASETPSRR
jgi:hypothetical protein